jgi:hypothetical protein
VAHLRDAAAAQRRRHQDHRRGAERALSGASDVVDDRRSKANLRLALILASVAIVFFVGFVAKMALFG